MYPISSGSTSLSLPSSSSSECSQVGADGAVEEAAVALDGGAVWWWEVVCVGVCAIGEAWMTWPLQESLKVALALRPFLVVAQRVHADGWLK